MRSPKLPSLACLLIFMAHAPVLRAAIYTVTSPYVNGTNTLRVAVNQANAHPGMDTIHFDIPGGILTIPIDSVGFTPIDITDSLRIDGLTQPGTSFPNQLLTYQITQFDIPLHFYTPFLEMTGLGWTSAGSRIVLRLSSFLPPVADLHIHHNRFHNVVGCLAMGLQSTSFHVIDFSYNALDCNVTLLEVEDWAFSAVDTIRFHANTGQSALCPVGQGYCRLAKLFFDFQVTVGAILMDSNSLDYVAPSLIQVDGGPHSPQGIRIHRVDIGHNTLIGGSNAIYPAIALTTGPGNSDTLEHVDIHDNAISRGSIGLWAYGGASPYPIMQHVRITRNTLTQQQQGAITLDMRYPNALGGTAKDILIDSNEVASTVGSGIMILTDPGLSNSIQGFTIRHNHIHDIDRYGILVSDNDIAFPGWSTALTGIQFSENRIENPAWQAIVVNGSAPQTQLMPCRLPTPALGWVTPQPPYTVHGDLTGPPNGSFRIEFFTNPQCVVESWTFIGADTLQLDANGNGHIAWPAGSTMPRYVTATATDLTTLNTGCISNAVDTMTVGIPEPLTASSLVLYPNPSHAATVHWLLDGTVNAITLTDAMGRETPVSRWTSIQGGGQMQLPELAAGLYRVRFRTEGGTRTATLRVD